MKKVFLMHGMSCGLDECFGLKLKEELKKLGYKIYEPKFPLAPNITIDNWTQEMDKFKQFIGKDDIFVCHSLSTNFILKYFARNNLQCKALIAVAGGLITGFGDVQKGFEYLWPLVPTVDEIEYCAKNIEKKFNVFNKDDHIWKQSEIARYTEVLGAKGIELEYGGHFGRSSGVKEIPELIEIVKEINN